MSSGIVKATQKLWHNLILAEKDTRASAPTSTIREIHFIYGKRRESRVRVCARVQVSQSHVQLFATPWTGQIGGCQSPLSMGFSRQEYWSGLLFLSPEDLPDPGTEPGSPAMQADSLLSDAPRWGAKPPRSSFSYHKAPSCSRIFGMNLQRTAFLHWFENLPITEIS